MIDFDNIDENSLADSIQAILPKYLQLEKHTILVVDDEENNLQFMKRTLRSDYFVLTANSAHQALEIMNQNGDEISLIVSDQRMPDMTGTEFLKIVAENIRLL